MIEGRLKLDQWDDKETGKKRQKLSVVVESCLFLNSGQGKEAAGERAPRQASERRETNRSAGDGGYGEGEQPPDSDDVPF